MQLTQPLAICPTIGMRQVLPCFYKLSSVQELSYRSFYNVQINGFLVLRKRDSQLPLFSRGSSAAHRAYAVPARAFGIRTSLAPHGVYICQAKQLLYRRADGLPRRGTIAV